MGAHRGGPDCGGLVCYRLKPTPNFLEILTSTKDVLTPADIAPILGCDGQKIRVQAKQMPETIPFHYIFVGNRMKIPRLAFIDWMTKSEIN